MLLLDKTGQFQMIGVLRGGGSTCGDSRVFDNTTDWTKVSLITLWIQRLMGGSLPVPNKNSTNKAPGENSILHL